MVNHEWSAKRLLGGKTLKEALRRPSQEATLHLLQQKLASNHPLRLLGTSADGDIPFLTEESRASHIHILGTTREGKSKFLEMFLAHDIGRYGSTLLDPSDNGATCYSVLRWAIAAKYEKICLIDPHDADVAIPCINPLRFRGMAATDAVVANIMDSLRVLWGQAEFNSTPRIEAYLPAILSVLYKAKATLPDAQCFLVKEDSHSAHIRHRLLDQIPKYDESRLILDEVFGAKGQQLFLGEFKASIRRLAPFFKYLPRLVYGSTSEPLDFHKMISEKWVILINLDKTRVWGTAQQRTLGILLINELVAAISDLSYNGWKGKHYLYIDEAGQFANTVLTDVMAYHGKLGLWATLAHQYYDQFKDKEILSAVEQLCHIKVLFHTPSSQDRQHMIRDMYTGDLKLTAADAHAALQKQHAVIKIGKQPPQTVFIRDVVTPKLSAEEVTKWKEEKIYKVNPWYRSADAIQEEISKRFVISTPQARTATAAPRAPSNINPQATPGEQSAEPSKGPDKAKPRRKSVFDDIAGS